MLSGLLDLIVRPFVFAYEFFSNRKYALFELIALGSIALAITVYLWHNTPLQELEVDIYRSNKPQHEKVLKESFGNSRFMGPKGGQSKVIKSLGNVREGSK